LESADVAMPAFEFCCVDSAEDILSKADVSSTMLV
jgi:hypothetical protein